MMQLTSWFINIRTTHQRETVVCNHENGEQIRRLFLSIKLQSDYLEQLLNDQYIESILITQQYTVNIGIQCLPIRFREQFNIPIYQSDIDRLRTTLNIKITYMNNIWPLRGCNCELSDDTLITIQQIQFTNNNTIIYAQCYADIQAYMFTVNSDL